MFHLWRMQPEIRLKIRQILDYFKQKTNSMSNPASTIPLVDLVIVIDTSPSMKDEAQALSDSAQSAITSAKSSCPSDLRVVWLGIEGTWKGTNFNQTVRNYLTQKCKVAATRLRGRTKGQLKSAGAQEDATRAIEDISDYFDWRKGAAKAIFYLGDEALEAGGDKTTQKDIEAANLAIQKAKAAEVTVHTYFGTSRSRYRQSIISEYARVADETGGRAFTYQDTISGFSTVLEQVICGSRTPKATKLIAGAVYIQDCNVNEMSKLYTLDLATGKATLIGEIVTEVYDIAFVGSQLYGLDQDGNRTQLVKIDLNTGDTTVIGTLGFAAAGLAYNPLRKTLYASTAKQLIAIDLETGKGNPVVTVAKQDYNCSEVAFDADGKAYITLIGFDRKKLLAYCDLDTGEVRTIGDIGFPNLASIDLIDNVLYGITGNFFDLGQDGQLIRIDPTTGKGTLVTATDPIGRWAGITTYQPVISQSEQTPVIPSQNRITQPIISQSEQTPIIPSQSDKTIQENDMSLLTINPKNNCYVINTDGMNHLQQNVANSLTLSQGTYELKISSGRYKFAKSKTEGEPFVFLWLYGIDGSTFINKNTGCETGATWTTLNGYNDVLQLEVRNQTVVCALFFDVNSSDNSGSIKLAITSNNPSFQPQELTVDSKKNCYILDEQYLSSLRQYNLNFVELKPGNYRIKIRESNATYWSSEQKFNLEPWALIWIKDGRVTPKLTGIETEETWCSLNGLQDELILEVKGNITLSGFFFDTYKDDNEGQIILAIEPISGEELTQLYQQKVTSTTGTTTEVSRTGVSDTGSSTGVGVGISQGRTEVNVGVSQGSMSFGGGESYAFRFDEAQMEEMWKKMAAKIETSVTVTDEQDEKQEAYYWDNLEKWILKGYQQQAKDLAMQVARVEFMMKAFTQQTEGSFNQIFQGWSTYFDSRLNDLVNNRMVTVIEEQVNRKFTQQTQDIKKLVIEQMQGEMDKRIETALNLKITQQTQDIKKLVIEQMQGEMDKRIETAVNVKITDQTPETNGFIIKQIQGDMDKRIDAVVNLKITDQTDNLKNLVVGQVQADIDKRIDNSVNVKIDAQTENIKNLAIGQIQADMDKRLEAVVNLKMTDQTEGIKNLVVGQIEANIDKRIQMFVEQSTGKNVDVVVNNVMGDIDNRINVNFEHKILNFREDVNSLVKNEINENYTESLKSMILADLKNQQFYFDMQSIKTEVQNFYSRLGQFETQLNLRITQGDARLYNWTLEQLVALQGCLTDRQALVELLESFSAKAKTVLDGAPCVQPSRFTAWVTTETNPQIEPMQPAQLPEGEQSK
jgi:hypothetical protein